VQILQAATSKVRPCRPVNFDGARGDGDHNALLELASVTPSHDAGLSQWATPRP